MYVHRSGSISNSNSPHRVCVAFYSLFWSPCIQESSPWGVSHCVRFPSTSYTKGGSQFLKIRQIPDAVWDGAREVVARKISATKITYTIRFRVKFKVHHIKSALHSTLYFKVPPSMNLLQGVWVLVIESLQFLTPKGAHKLWRFVKFPMLSGMRPVSWLDWRSLQPNVRTQIRFGVKFKVHHIKSALHSTLYF